MEVLWKLLVGSYLGVVSMLKPLLEMFPSLTDINLVTLFADCCIVYTFQSANAPILDLDCDVILGVRDFLCRLDFRTKFATAALLGRSVRCFPLVCMHVILLLICF